MKSLKLSWLTSLLLACILSCQNQTDSVLNDFNIEESNSRISTSFSTNCSISNDGKVYNNYQAVFTVSSNISNVDRYEWTISGGTKVSQSGNSVTISISDASQLSINVSVQGDETCTTTEIYQLSDPFDGLYITNNKSLCYPMYHPLPIFSIANLPSGATVIWSATNAYLGESGDTRALVQPSSVGNVSLTARVTYKGKSREYSTRKFAIPCDDGQNPN
ncbi:hypothetical protein [Flammeovirga kamogawensis]|uniref:PKD-like domain-containing protein n=1 Tax=Flammeovirga kamogawensis TaxID=373891 RepID=A0ABX8H0R3_9BACT|nr:hypothetical protein [Flammeovirga kamogawensis]MBB6462364.1 hypothetical protein [Flammeovirga kamogawensis]QWG09478.1 hypothetical protein KM029_23000 [Flammeovirga kamogawensis]TRX64994.1 hypothetical protein EO216_20900 [Flammeovirga kamogawensis]